MTTLSLYRLRIAGRTTHRAVGRIREGRSTGLNASSCTAAQLVLVFSKSSRHSVKDLFPRCNIVGRVIAYAEAELSDASLPESHVLIVLLRSACIIAKNPVDTVRFVLPPHEEITKAVFAALVGRIRDPRVQKGGFGVVVVGHGECCVVSGRMARSDVRGEGDGLCCGIDHRKVDLTGSP